MPRMVATTELMAAVKDFDECAEEVRGALELYDHIRGEVGEDRANTLLGVADAGKNLPRLAERVRHNLPDRQTDEPSLDFTLRNHRYAVVWPDGELLSYGYLYSQRPQALVRFGHAAERYPELRLYDIREKKFLTPDEARIERMAKQ